MQSQAEGDDRYLTELAKGFELLLNKHGFGFQYAVVSKLNKLFEEKKIVWFVDVAEFPVATLEFDTKIDFVIRPNRNIRFFLVAECKRSDPSLKDWCSVRAPFVARNRQRESMIVEHVIATYTAIHGTDRPKRVIADGK